MAIGRGGYARPAVVLHAGIVRDVGGFIRVSGQNVGPRRVDELSGCDALSSSWSALLTRIVAKEVIDHRTATDLAFSGFV